MAKRELIKLSDAAEEIGLSIRTLQKWAKDGKLPTYKINGCRLNFIDRKIWDEWKARNITAA